MKKRYILATSLVALLLLVGCSENIVEPEDPVETETETEVFSDSVVADNIDALLDGFTLNGTIVQTRYSAIDTEEVDEYGDEVYEVDYESDPLETNTYYTNVKFDNLEQNKFYKYSYRNVNDVEIAAEGPYTYYEDDEGYAYTSEISYDNELNTSYNQSSASGGRKLNFAANGFYNFFSIFIDGDFVIDEEVSTTNYVRYDINPSKASIIANNLLYSLNSGAYSTIEEAYILCINNVFTQLVIDLTPIQSVDDTTSEITYIGNTATFVISDIGTTTIETPTPYEETEESKELDEVLDSFGSNFTVTVENNYSYDETYTSSTSTTSSGTESETTTYFFTGNEIYIHEGSSGLDESSDFFLASDSSSTSNLLYPYAYSSDYDAWIMYDSGLTIDDDVKFASGYCGYYTYDDLLPIIAGVSGAVFEYDSTNNEYDAIYDVISDMVSDSCFIINKQPLRTSGYPYISTLSLNIEDGNLVMEAGYSYSDYNATYYIGSITATYRDVGITTLPEFVESY